MNTFGNIVVVDAKLSAGRGLEFSASWLEDQQRRQRAIDDGLDDSEFRSLADARPGGLGFDGYDDGGEGEQAGPASDMNTAIPHTNLGYRMLLKLGWKGRGLGKNEDGMLEPIRAGVEANVRLGVGKQGQDDFFTAAENVTRKRLEVEVQATEDPDRTRKREELAENLNRIQAEVLEIKRTFLCEMCSKQYQSAMELDAHLSSYDHHHKKRLIEMKAMDSARNKGERDRKAAKAGGKEMARLQKHLQVQLLLVTQMTHLAVAITCELSAGLMQHNSATRPPSAPVWNPAQSAPASHATASPASAPAPASQAPPSHQQQQQQQQQQQGWHPHAPPLPSEPFRPHSTTCPASNPGAGQQPPLPPATNQETSWQHSYTHQPPQHHQQQQHQQQQQSAWSQQGQQWTSTHQPPTSTALQHPPPLPQAPHYSQPGSYPYGSSSSSSAPPLPPSHAADPPPPLPPSNPPTAHTACTHSLYQPPLPPTSDPLAPPTLSHPSQQPSGSLPHGSSHHPRALPVPTMPQPSSLQGSGLVKSEPRALVTRQDASAPHAPQQHARGASSCQLSSSSGDGGSGLVPPTVTVKTEAGAPASLSFGFAGGRGKSSVKGLAPGGRMGGMVIRPAAGFSSGGPVGTGVSGVGATSLGKVAGGKGVSMFADSDDDEDDPKVGAGKGLLGARKGARAVGRRALDDGC
ncbi:MAG: hypothetical protein WDW36_007252 [Sanguina aurantia]